VGTGIAFGGVAVAGTSPWLAPRDWHRVLRWRSGDWHRTFPCLAPRDGTAWLAPCAV